VGAYWLAIAVAAGLGSLTAGGAKTHPAEAVQSGCLACHQDIELARELRQETLQEVLALGQSRGDPAGCVVCHKGNPNAREKPTAHHGLVGYHALSDRQRSLLVLLYNVFMAVADTAALIAVARSQTVPLWFGVCCAHGVAALALAAGVAAVCAGDLFAVFRLATYGVFLHAVALFGGSALLLRRIRPKAAVASAALALLGIAIAVDALLIEPNWLEVSRFRIRTAKITRPVRLVVIADFQTDAIGPYEESVLRRALRQRPHLILFAGDYLDAGTRQQRYRLVDELNAYLMRLSLSAPEGVFAVEGNVDRPDWVMIFNGLPVHAVVETESFELDELRLTCLSERDSFNPRLEITDGAPGRFHVVLGHSPRYALGRVEADLLIAGHTHGGQVCLPLVGPVVWHSAIPRRWASGLGELTGGRKLYVSRGVGTHRGWAPRLRFLCRPELAVIDLVPVPKRSAPAARPQGLSPTRPSTSEPVPLERQ